MWKWLYVMSFIFLLAGCGDREKIMMYPGNNDEDQQKKIEQLIEEDAAIEEANVLLLEKELFVALQLKPLKKWNKQKIEKKWKKKLEQQFSNREVLVSTDFKLFWESTKLMDEKDQQKVLQELKELKKLAKEET